MKLADSAAPRRYDVQHHSLLHFVAQASWPNAAAPGHMRETAGMTQTSSSSPMGYLVTPDGRYFVVRDRLWRFSNPSLSTATRERLVKELMQARSDVRRAKGSVQAARRSTAACRRSQDRVGRARFPVVG